MMMVFQLIWVIKVMPETKGVTLEGIQKKLLWLILQVELKATVA